MSADSTTSRLGGLAWFSLAGLCCLIAISLLASLLPLADPLRQDAFHTLAAPSLGHLLGTDGHGRDILSRVIYGSQVSLFTSISSIGMAAVLGTILGITAGYHNNWVEVVIMRVSDSLMALPSLILGIAIMAILGPGLDKVIFCIAFVMTPRFIRIAYGATMVVRPQEFIEAARAISAPFGRIFRVHILPNIVSEISVVAALWVGTAIQIEASLSFIGIGVPPPSPTWGNMIREGLDYLSMAPWIALAPSVAIFCTIILFNLAGDSIRDIIDPKHYRRA